MFPKTQYGLQRCLTWMQNENGQQSGKKSREREDLMFWIIYKVRLRKK